MSSPALGSLAVVGTGIRAGHLTPETRAAIVGADEVLYLTAAGETWPERLNANAHSLAGLYRENEPREEAYERMVEAILEPVRAGKKVCAAFYGHPGVYVTPSHEAIRRARELGVDARMLPAISAEDCLFADLGIDPGLHGCQSYEATAFLEAEPPLNTRATLVLWQISVVSERRAVTTPNPEGLAALAERLLRDYRAGHEVIVYEASPFPMAAALVTRVPLEALGGIPLRPLSTLVVPPVG